MPVKHSPSIIPRFTGNVGKNNLLAAIHAQRVVAWDRALARKLVKAGVLREFSPQKVILRQGGSDNDLYLIVSGSVGVVINNREIGTRSSGTHFGEMAMLDSTARRSASTIILAAT